MWGGALGGPLATLVRLRRAYDQPQTPVLTYIAQRITGASRSCPKAMPRCRIRGMQVSQPQRTMALYASLTVYAFQQQHRNEVLARWQCSCNVVTTRPSSSAVPARCLCRRTTVAMQLQCQCSRGLQSSEQTCASAGQRGKDQCGATAEATVTAQYAGRNAVVKTVTCQRQ